MQKGDNVRSKWSIFQCMFLHSHNTHAPLKSLWSRDRKSPWVATELKALFHQKDNQKEIDIKTKKSSNEDYFKQSKFSHHQSQTGLSATIRAKLDYQPPSEPNWIISHHQNRIHGLCMCIHQWIKPMPNFWNSERPFIYCCSWNLSWTNLNTWVFVHCLKYGSLIIGNRTQTVAYRGNWAHGQQTSILLLELLKGAF